MFLNSLIYIASFFLIWFGSGLIVSSTSKFSRRLRLSSFVFSFVFLGLLTSSPEFALGLQAVADNDPEIFIGNLIGGVVVLFLFVIPLLAVFGNGINLKNELENKTLVLTLLVILMPIITIIDKKVSSLEGLFLIVLYAILIFFVERKHGLFDKKNNGLFDIKSYSYKDILKIFIGIGLIFISSNIILNQTLFFADFFNIPAFYISLVILGLGTNLPELALAMRSAVAGKKDIAMGDYLGSAAANTFLFGLFTILVGGAVLTVNNFIVTFLFVASSLILFYFFYYTKKFISRINGFLMLGIYVLFVVVEFIG